MKDHLGTPSGSTFQMDASPKHLTCQSGPASFFPVSNLAFGVPSGSHCHSSELPLKVNAADSLLAERGRFLELDVSTCPPSVDNRDLMEVGHDEVHFTKLGTKL